MGKDIKVIVAAHKKYEMPKDKMYVPVQVGAEGKKDIGYTKDNTHAIDRNAPYGHACTIRLA